MWEPLFKAKFGAWADKISMTWFYGRLHGRFGPAKEGAPRGCLGYIKGSTQVLVDALLERLKAKGVELRPSHAVKSLRAKDGRITGLSSKAGDEDFDQVIVTCSTPEFLGMEAGILPPALRQDLEQFKYYGSVVAVLELKSSVSPVYWTNVLDTAKPFLAVIEHTRMIPPSEYQGAHILYLARYLDTQDAFFRAPEAEVLATYYGHLKDVCPGFRPQPGGKSPCDAGRLHPAFGHAGLRVAHPGFDPADSGPFFGQHDPDLPRRPGHELFHRLGRQGRRPGPCSAAHEKGTTRHGTASFQEGPGAKKPSISVFFPAYNEEANLGALCLKTAAVLKGLASSWEVIAVNDGSKDRTAAVVEALHKKEPRIRVVSHKVNAGYGAAVKTGFKPRPSTSGFSSPTATGSLTWRRWRACCP